MGHFDTYLLIFFSLPHVSLSSSSLRIPFRMHQMNNQTNQACKLDFAHFQVVTLSYYRSSLSNKIRLQVKQFPFYTAQQEMEEKHDSIIKRAGDMICLQGQLIYYLSLALILGHVPPDSHFLKGILQLVYETRHLFLSGSRNSQEKNGNVSDGHHGHASTQQSRSASVRLQMASQRRGLRLIAVAYVAVTPWQRTGEEQRANTFQ